MLGARMIAVTVAALTVSTISTAAVAAEHKCDPVTDAGWSVVPEREVLSQTDGAPYQSGTDWLVDRVTTVLPFCNYYNSIGIYSMRSYSLDPEMTQERIAVCTRTADGGSAAVPPYMGPCPPKPGRVTR
jgi:putative component of membrane protein insertase Oxa1/YidC/SpoIIIJ protein YidD